MPAGPVLPEPTARLTFARPTHVDVDEMFAAYASDPEVTRYLVWPTHQSPENTRMFIAFSDDQWERWPSGPLLVRRRDTGELIGGTGLAFAGPTHASTGYVFARAAWGKGFATETLQAMVSLAAACRVTELEAGCHPDHVASQRVLEKCGFVPDPDFVGTTEFPNLVVGLQQPVLRFVHRFDACNRVGDVV